MVDNVANDVKDDRDVMNVATEVIYFKEEARKLFQSEVILKRLASGYGFSEGPVFVEAENCLYFTDFPNDKIYKWDEQEGVRIYTEKSNRAIGLTLDQKGQIVSCESRMHRVAFVDQNGSQEIAGFYQGKRFSSPNDVIISKSGDIYFSDPFSKVVNQTNEQGFNGVYHVLVSGEVRLVTKELGRPNGLCFNRAETVLYVNDTDENRIYKFERNEAGEYVNRAVFANLDERYGEGACDGMKVDQFDNVWVTGPAGMWVMDKNGECIAILKCPEFVGNFCFGGMNRDELFITASSSLYWVKLGGVIY